MRPDGTVKILLLFEMLTGQRAFKGEDITDTIVAVISKEPDWSSTSAVVHRKPLPPRPTAAAVPGMLTASSCSRQNWQAGNKK